MPPDSGSDMQQQRSAYIRNVHTTMVIALYNMGVEHEHMLDIGQALEFFQRAQSYNTEFGEGREGHMARIISEAMQGVI